MPWPVNDLPAPDPSSPGLVLPLQKNMKKSEELLHESKSWMCAFNRLDFSEQIVKGGSTIGGGK